jgi:hypothetical protein
LLKEFLIHAEASKATQKAIEDFTRQAFETLNKMQIAADKKGFKNFWGKINESNGIILM